ncbi:MAG: SCO family protein [Rhodospirillaceae bacterium]|jgi:cytochrome oxidase Cu insertion factor (SCO1/SenC/PrrC family)|nr:SCO family protein [Rhodospirillaceae bacterium]MBT5374848.1 SCO family protein [Rhodospirillaceae bacterium]MBT5659178.1 SCO family protein [Rhodospirillaceae bacterium]MBT5751492.1 SCO family protein [Rhodospirillaceae bacterium]
MTRKLTYGGLLIVLLLGAITAWVYESRLTSDSSINPTVTVGGPFSLIDQNGVRRSQDDFAGSYMLVNFGYTFCPDVCPTALRDISAAIDLLGADGEKVIPVFITIDPERDTVEKLKPYAAHFHPRLVALTGGPDEIKAAAKAYRIYYARADLDLGDGDYLMDHSSLYYLMGPDGKFIRHFSFGAPADEMAAAIRAQL